MFGDFYMSALDLLLDGAVEGATETPLEPLPTTADRTGNHRHGQALVGVLTNPGDGLGDEFVVNRQYIRGTPRRNVYGRNLHPLPCDWLLREGKAYERRRAPAYFFPRNHHARERR